MEKITKLVVKSLSCSLYEVFVILEGGGNTISLHLL